MAFTIPNGVTDVIKALSNFPNRIDRLKATQLKAMFDQAAKNVQADVKRLVSELCEPTAAGNIGFAPTDGVNKTNIQAAIENVQSQLVEITQEGVADNSITEEKIADGAVTKEKIADGAVAFEDVSSQYEAFTGLGSAGVTESEITGTEFRYIPALGIIAFNLHVSIETQEASVLSVVCAGPYTPRKIMIWRAAYASLCDRMAKNFGVSVNADISGVENTSGEYDGNDYLEIKLHVSGAVFSCV